jgi:excisionase family DNA binding protein
MVNETTSEALMTAGELADYLRLSKASIYRLSEDGTIPTIRLGIFTIRFRLSDVMEALENHGSKR